VPASNPTVEKVVLVLPEQFSIRGRMFGAEIAHLSRTKTVFEADVVALNHSTFRGFRAVGPDGASIAIIDRETTSSVGCDLVLRVPDASTIAAVQTSLQDGAAAWIYPKTRRSFSLSWQEFLQRAADIRSNLETELYPSRPRSVSGGENPRINGDVAGCESSAFCGESAVVLASVKDAMCRWCR
jgi:hypothetical protein